MADKHAVLIQDSLEVCLSKVHLRALVQCAERVAEIEARTVEHLLPQPLGVALGIENGL